MVTKREQAIRDGVTNGVSPEEVINFIKEFGLQSAVVYFANLARSVAAAKEIKQKISLPEGHEIVQPSLPNAIEMKGVPHARLTRRRKGSGVRRDLENFVIAREGRNIKP